MPRSKASTLAALAMTCGLGTLQPLLAANADPAAQPQFTPLRAGPSAQAKPAAPELEAAPTSFEVRGVLMADGTVGVDCHEVANREVHNHAPEHGDRNREAH